MNTQNHYEILGVSQNATLNEIKIVYRQLQLQYHPDRTSHLSEVDREIGEAISKAANNAYEILVDENRRRKYDEKIACQASMNTRKPAQPETNRSQDALNWRHCPITDENLMPFQAFGFYISYIPLFMAVKNGWLVFILLSPRFYKINSKAIVRGSNWAIHISAHIRQTWIHCPSVRDLHLVVCKTPENNQVSEVRSYISRVRCIEPGNHSHGNHSCQRGKVTTFRIVILLNENTSKSPEEWRTRSSFFGWKDIVRYSSLNWASANVFTRGKPGIDGNGKLKPEAAQNMLEDDEDSRPLEIVKTSVFQTWRRNWRDFYCSMALGREGDVGGF